MAGYTYIPNIHIELASFVKARDRRSDKAYASYQIVVTIPSPFRRWKVERRFCQFQALYNFFAVNRKLQCKFPKPSVMNTIKLSGSLSAMASARLRPLEAFLVEIVGLPDLTVNEINQLYPFLEIDSFGEFSYRDSDFDGVRCNLFENMSPPGTERDDSTDDSGSNREKNVVARDVIELNMDSSHSGLRYSDIRKTDDFAVSSPGSSNWHASVERDNGESRQRVYSVSAEGMKEALRNNDSSAVRELLRKEPQLARRTDNAGNPAIYTAALYGTVELGVALISAGADPHAPNRQGISAMDIAFDPWRVAVSTYIARINEELTLSENLTFAMIKTVAVRRSNGSLGINIAKSPEGEAVVIGFNIDAGNVDRSPGRDIHVPDIRPNDVICGVADINTYNFNDTIEMIKSCTGPVKLTLRRALKS
jgi:hypothetical protein